MNKKLLVWVLDERTPPKGSALRNIVLTAAMIDLQGLRENTRLDVNGLAVLGVFDNGCK